MIAVAVLLLAAAPLCEGWAPAHHRPLVRGACPPSRLQGCSDDADVAAKVARALNAVDKLKGTSYAAGWAPSGTPQRQPSTLIHGGGSRLFLDTADERLWKGHLDMGLYRGITTNPELLERAGVACTVASIGDLARSALEDHGCSEFMAQAWGGNAASLVRTGTALAGLDGANNRVVVKVPLTPEGVKAARALGVAGVRVCLTACYSREQVFVAAGLGAEYVAPYLGRMASDGGKDGVAECAAMQRLLRGMGSSTRLLVASLRDPAQLSALAEAGCDTFTFSPAIAEGLLAEPSTARAAADFEAAARAMGGTQDLAL